MIGGRIRPPIMAYNAEYQLFVCSGKMLLVSVERHAVGFHADHFSYVCKYLFVLLASFLSLACDEVEVGCCVCKYLVNEVDDEFHVLLHEAS